MPHPLGYLRCDGARDEDPDCEELTYEQIAMLVDVTLEDAIAVLFTRLSGSEPIEGCVVGSLLSLASKISCDAGMSDTEVRAVFEMSLDGAREVYPYERRDKLHS